ncbi:MAG: hypothetical protein IJF73_06610 [Clostridia bacterium]|nr:hypothetical protein [Clostridia bacterium]
MKPLRILHVGSVVLGMPYLGLSLEKCKERHRRFPEVFDGLFDYIKRESIDLVLFSGNLCSRYLTSEDARHLIALLGGVPSCTFVISPGDQDPYDVDSLYVSGRLPKNVRIFENEALEYVDLPALGARVYGWAIHGQRSTLSPLAGAAVEDSETLNLLSGCCSIGSRSLFVHVTPEEIAAFGADYAAFSHGPSTPVRRAGKTLYCHAGFLEGHSFEEGGEGGVVRIDVDEDRTLSTRFVPLYRHRYETVTLDITGAKDMSEVLAALRPHVEERGFGEETSLRVILEGRLEPTVMLSPSPEEALSFSLYSLDFIDRTRPTLNAEYLERDMTVRGELYRTLLPRINSQNLEESVAVSQAFRAGLAALESRDITGI